MNELLILGLVLAVFTVVCAAVEAVESRDAIVAWLDREITAHYAARIAKRRVREIWQIRRCQCARRSRRRSART